MNTSHASAFLQADCGDMAKHFVVKSSLHALRLIFIT